jgi:hypothetical protein
MKREKPTDPIIYDHDMKKSLEQKFGDIEGEAEPQPSEED